jgi:UDP-glucose 4-epimerase
LAKYLVTGAAGFIGSHLARRLYERGDEVWTIDNLSTGYEKNIPAGVHFIQGDCQDQKSLKQLNDNRFDAILHFAGQSSGEISFDDPVYDLRTNTESTLLLINYGLNHGCNRFIYASSMSVYGEVDDKAISESHPTKPLSFYGIGKLASENYLRIYQSKGLQATSLRLFNVYGTNQNMSNLRQGMVSIFLAQLLNNNEIVVKGSLDRYRDFLFINDCVDFTLKVLADKISIGKIYNVGTGIKTTVKELLEKLKTFSKISKNIQQSDPTPGDQKGIFADISLARRELNFFPEYDLDKGLSEMVQWARETPLN